MLGAQLAHQPQKVRVRIDFSISLVQTCFLLPCNPQSLQLEGLPKCRASCNQRDIKLSDLVNACYGSRYQLASGALTVRVINCTVDQLHGVIWAAPKVGVASP